jgi:hypothetical protein
VSFADSGEVLLSREKDRVSLCINSFSTHGEVERRSWTSAPAGRPTTRART